MQRTLYNRTKLHLHRHEGTGVVVDTRNFIDTSSRSSSQDLTVLFTHLEKRGRGKLNLVDKDHENQGLHSLYFHPLTNEKNCSW